MRLTAKGRRIATRCREIFTETEDEFFAMLSHAERETLRALLYKVCRASASRD